MAVNPTQSGKRTRMSLTKMKEEFYTRLRPLVKSVRDHWKGVFALWPNDPEFSTHPWDDEEFELLHSYRSVKSLSKRQYWRSCLAGKLKELADATRRCESFVDNLILVAASHKFKKFLESEKKLESYLNLSDLHPSGLQPGELILNAITGLNWEVVSIGDLVPGDQLLFSYDEQCLLRISPTPFARARPPARSGPGLPLFDGLCILKEKELLLSTVGGYGRQTLQHWSFQLMNSILGDDDVSHFFTVTYLSEELLIGLGHCLVSQGDIVSVNHFFMGSTRSKLIARLRKS
jgi:hypothetical protein